MARVCFILSAGAAKAVVSSMQPAFESQNGATLHATFGAVGAMREKFLAGDPCDVLVLSAVLLDALAQEGKVDRATRVSLGRVGTGIAVRAGAALPPIGDGAALKATLLAATALYLPDPERATAGIHCIDVLKRLDVLEVMRPRLRPYPNGAAAMAALAADAQQENPLGCTQVTEILYTPGVALAGKLPAGFELSTEYAAAVTTGARDRDLARRFVAELGGVTTATVRRAGGFEL